VCAFQFGRLFSELRLLLRQLGVAFVQPSPIESESLRPSRDGFSSPQVYQPKKLALRFQSDVQLP